MRTKLIQVATLLSMLLMLSLFLRALSGEPQGDAGTSTVKPAATASSTAGSALSAQREATATASNTSGSALPAQREPVAAASNTPGSSSPAEKELSDISAATAPEDGKLETTRLWWEPPQSEEEPEAALRFSFLQNKETLTHSHVLKWLRDNHLIPEHAGALDRPRFRPFAPWSRWENKHLRLIPSVVFLLLSSALCWFLAPGFLDRAEAQSSQSYWRCLGQGIIVSLVVLTFARFALMSMIGWPAAVVLLGVFQLFLVTGASVVSSMIGRSLSCYLRAERLPLLLDQPKRLRALHLILGTLVLALLLQLGSLGHLPKIGTRLVCLLAILGGGGLYRAWRSSSMVER